MVSYFLLGGAYSMQIKGHVRMELLYGSWSERTQCRWDVFTSIFLVSYLLCLTSAPLGLIEVIA
jgi:TRAP-type mannitol/chloroaromatic compound transport system permease small subunit